MPTTHAEINAINKVKNYKNIPKKIDLLVVRFTKTGLLAESKPCYHCVQSMLQSNLNIINVYYSTQNGIIKEKMHKLANDKTVCFSSGMRFKHKIHK